MESDFSFSGQVYTCRVPMDRIWAAYLPEGDLEHGIVWEENVPETIRAVVNAVRSIQENKEEPEASADETKQMDVDEKPVERKIRHLRVIK